MTPQPLSELQLTDLMTAVGTNLLTNQHPADVLTLAGFIATNALRRWAPEDRIHAAAAWTDTVLATVRESLD